MRNLWLVLVLTATNVVLLIVSAVCIHVDLKNSGSALQSRLHILTCVWAWLNVIPLFYALAVSEENVLLLSQILLLVATHLPINYMNTFVQISFGVNDRIRGNTQKTSCISGTICLAWCYAAATAVAVFWSLWTGKKLHVLWPVCWGFCLVVAWWMLALTIMSSTRLKNAVRRSKLTSTSNLARVKVHGRTITLIVLLMTVLSCYQVSVQVSVHTDRLVESSSKFMKTVLLPNLLMTLMAVASACGGALTRTKASAVSAVSPRVTYENKSKAGKTAVRAAVKLSISGSRAKSIQLGSTTLGSNKRNATTRDMDTSEPSYHMARKRNAAPATPSNQDLDVSEPSYNNITMDGFTTDCGYAMPMDPLPSSQSKLVFVGSEFNANSNEPHSGEPRHPRFARDSSTSNLHSAERNFSNFSSELMRVIDEPGKFRELDSGKAIAPTQPLTTTKPTPKPKPKPKPNLWAKVRTQYVQSEKKSVADVTFDIIDKNF